MLQAMENYRSVWYPEVFDRRNHEQWTNAGGLDACSRARQRARELIASHEPEAIDSGVLADLEAIVSSADAQLGTNSRP